MSMPGTLTAALDALPSWWRETNDAAEFDRLFGEWAKACDWDSAGFLWPAEGAPLVNKTVPDAASSDRAVPVEFPEILAALRAGEPTVLVATDSGNKRVYAAVAPSGRPLGVVWAEKGWDDEWSDADRSYLALVGKTLERSPALAAAIGPAIDPERLAQRLSDAAIIAGRMAHDFDNILTGIMGFADLTLPLLPAGSQQQSFVGEIAKVGQRGITFTQQLHQLSRSGQVRPTPGSVIAAIGREEARIKPAMHPALTVERDLFAGLPAVAMDAGPLQTVLGHVLENAVEACPRGGKVRIAGRIVELSEADGRSYLGKVSAGSHLLVTITDSGPGIAPEVRRKLFVEPFFTTKVRHRGLGLAVAYRILASHRGGIQVEPVEAPATGTQVKIVLPVAPQRLPAVTDATPPPALTGRSNTVLMNNLRSTIVRG